MGTQRREDTREVLASTVFERNFFLRPALFQHSETKKKKKQLYIYLNAKTTSL